MSMQMLFKDKKQMYMAMAVGAVLLEVIYIFYIPTWVKSKFGPVPLEEAPLSSKMDLNDLRSLGTVFVRLETLLWGKGLHLVSLTVPLHKLQLALATYLVQINQEWMDLQWDAAEKEDPAVAAGAVNRTAEELLELTERYELADWAYLESSSELEKQLQGRGYVLLRHDTEAVSGNRGHFAAFQAEQKEFAVGIQGNPVLADLLSTIPGKHKEFKLPNNPFTGENETFEFQAPAAEMDTALHIMEQIKPILENFVLPSEYKIALHGHSLGGGCAALLGLALRANLPDHKDRIHVYAYGPSAVLNETNAIASAAFVTSVVNRADVVPRVSSQSVTILKDTVTNIEKYMQQKRYTPKDSQMTMILIRKMLSKGGSSFFESSKELEPMKRKALEKADSKNQLHLVVPGRVVALYGKETDESFTETGSYITDGSNDKMKYIQLEKSLLWDHTRQAYSLSLKEASEQSTSTTAKRQHSRKVRLQRYCKQKLKVWFHPTTRLDSPFAALIIVWIMLLTKVIKIYTSTRDVEQKPKPKPLVKLRKKSVLRMEPKLYKQF